MNIKKLQDEDLIVEFGKAAFLMANNKSDSIYARYKRIQKELERRFDFLRQLEEHFISSQTRG